MEKRGDFTEKTPCLNTKDCDCFKCRKTPQLLKKASEVHK